MGCYVWGDKNSMGCFVWGGKSLWDVLSGVSKNGMGCFVLRCFVGLPASPIDKSGIFHSTEMDLKHKVEPHGIVLYDLTEHFLSFSRGRISAQNNSQSKLATYFPIPCLIFLIKTLKKYCFKKEMYRPLLLMRNNDPYQNGYFIQSKIT